jgi:SNF2 family DNA or RNA helicase
MNNFLIGFNKQAKLKETTTLQPHQERVLKRLDKKPGVLAYHGLGSGKTLTSLAASQDSKTDVVTPASLRENYKKEVKKHTTNFKPNIQSFEQAVKTAPSGNTLVVDEAHLMGIQDSARSKKMQEKAKNYDKRILLTGTPIRNHPSELAPLINTVRGDDAMPVSRPAFDEMFIQEESVKPGFFARVVHGAKPGVSYRIKNVNKLRDMVDGYIDYHKPSNENFPSASHEVVETPMSKEQLKYYDFVMGKANPALRWKIKMGLPPSKSEAKQLNSFLSGARQVSNSVKGFGGSQITPKIQTAVNAFMERHNQDPNFKALIYSNFLESGVKDYARELEKRKIPHAVFDGSLSDKKRKQIVEDYNSGKLKSILITGAGSQGLDLKGTKLVQLLEPHWNDPRTDQATGRAIRFGSHTHLPEDERHVHVQKFHSTIPKGFIKKMLGKKNDTSVDQYLSMLSQEKTKLNDQFLQVLQEVGRGE